MLMKVEAVLLNIIAKVIPMKLYRSMNLLDQFKMYCFLEFVFFIYFVLSTFCRTNKTVVTRNVFLFHRYSSHLQTNSSRENSERQFLLKIEFICDDFLLAKTLFNTIHEGLPKVLKKRLNFLLVLAFSSQRNDRIWGCIARYRLMVNLLHEQEEFFYIPIFCFLFSSWCRSPRHLNESKLCSEFPTSRGCHTFTVLNNLSSPDGNEKRQ